MRGVRLLFGVFLVGWLAFVAGCGFTRHPPRPDAEHSAGGSSTTTTTGEGGNGGDLFSDGGGGEGGGPACAHQCITGPPAWFQGLSMFWIGPPDDMPPCPAEAPLEGSTGYADPIAPHTCPACSCSPAACALSASMHASAAKCADANTAPSIDWNAPPGWEGVCTADDAIPAGLTCAGVPCVQSITIAAPHVEPCTPSEQGAAVIAPVSWGKVARECMIGPLSGEGCATGEACAPAPPDDGFTLCIYRYGDHPTLKCPDEYPRRVDVFGGFADDRACEPCSCGDPEGAECSTLVSVYSDGACDALLGTYLLTSAMEDACHDLPPGVALGSKDASFLIDEPGTCVPTGGAAGAITLADPVVLCCLPEPEPSE